jgi:hypothetical protein
LYFEVEVLEMRIRLFQILMVPIRVEGVWPTRALPPSKVRNAQFVAIIVLLHTAPVGNAKPTGIYDPTSLDFVLVELDLAATFCDLALSTQDQERKNGILAMLEKLMTAPDIIYRG